MIVKSTFYFCLACSLLLGLSCSQKAATSGNKSSNPSLNSFLKPDTSGLWKDIENQQSIKDSKPNFRLLSLDFNGMKKLLMTAPKEKDKQTAAGTIVNLPLPEGTFQTFFVYETEVMSPELAAKFPEIKTYGGNGITEPSTGIRLDINPGGFHAILITVKGSIIINPKSQNDFKNYICYYKEVLSQDSRHPFDSDTLK